MDCRARKRLAAVLMVATLMLGALGFLATQAEATTGKRIDGFVFDSSDGFPEPGVAVALIEAHGDFSLSATTDASGYFRFLPMPGTYYLRLSKTGFFTKFISSPLFTNATTYIKFNGSADISLGEVVLEKFGSGSRLTVTTGEQGILVTVVDQVHRQRVATNTTNATGNATFDLWNTNFWVMFNRTGRETEVRNVAVAGNTVFNMPGTNLNASRILRVIPLGDNDEPVSAGVTASLFDLNTSQNFLKRLITPVINASAQASVARFDAYAGNFLLTIDADGYKGEFRDIGISTSTSSTSIFVKLNRTPENAVATRVNFSSNWSRMTVEREVNLARDGVVEGLGFGHLRNSHLQVDLNFGGGTGFDGTVSASETMALWDHLNLTGPNNITTANFLTLNDRTYEWDGNFTISSPQISSSGITYTATVGYRVVGTIAPNLDRYFLNISLRHDRVALSLNFSASYNIPVGWERIPSTVPPTVQVTDYTNIKVDPRSGTGYVRVNLILQKSKTGNAFAKVVGPPDKFWETNRDLLRYHAIIPSNLSVQFSGEDSTWENAPDGRAQPDFNYTWEFVMGNADTRNYTMRPTWRYTTSGNYTVLLSLTYPNGTVRQRQINVTVDDVRPTGVPQFRDSNIDLNIGVKLKERETAKFSVVNAQDFTFGNNRGVIRGYEWDFQSDGRVDATTAAVQWSYAVPGRYNATVRVIDGAGNPSQNYTFPVLVIDITPPTVSLTITNAVTGETAELLTEGVEYKFDAGGTTDNVDGVDRLTFQWEFGDGASGAGREATHTYSNFGTYTLRLRVNDRAGENGSDANNVGHLNRTMVVSPDFSRRPDLSIRNLTIEPRQPEESTFIGTSRVKITFNLTNNGDVWANNITILLTAFRQGESAGRPEEIRDANFYLPDGNLAPNQSVGPKETRRVEFFWSAGAAGNWTIRVNASDAREPPQRISAVDNSLSVQTTVNQAAWKTPVLYGSIPAIIIGVFALLILRRRLAARAEEAEEEGGRLTRRQRAARREEEGAEEEEEE